MPIIPRYQPRGGPSVGGLNYAGAYSPPDGSDWRILSRAMDAFGPGVQAAHSRIHEDRRSRKGGEDSSGGGDPDEQGPGPDQAALIEGVEGDVVWRDQVKAMGEGLDPQAVALSRQQIGAGMSEAGREVFDMATRPRERGFISQARYNGEQAAQARWEALALRREQLGVEEYARLVDIDAEAGRAALGSAIAQRAQRMMAAGATSEATQAARRTLVVDAEMARLGHTLRLDPDRAEALLAETGRLLPEAAQAEVMEAIGAERLRREAQQTVEGLAAGLDDPVGNLDALELGARAAAGLDPARQAAFSGAATGLWRRARADLEAREDAAMARLSPRLKAGGDIASWTDLPTEAWKALSARQQAVVRGHLQSPWRDSDPVAMGLLKDMAGRQPGAFKDFDLMSLGDRLSLDDLQDWRTLQQQARSGEPGWRREQAVMAGMARAIDRAGEAAGDPAFRGAAYAAFDQAQVLKGADLSPQELANACLALQADWRTGVAAPEPRGGGPARLIQASDPKVSIERSRKQQWLSDRDRALNLLLNDGPMAADGLSVNAEGEVVRRGPRRYDQPAGFPPGNGSEEVVSDEEARRFLARRLGVDPEDTAALDSAKAAFLIGGVGRREKYDQLALRFEAARLYDDTPEVRALGRLLAWAEGATYNTLYGDARDKINGRPIAERHPGRVSGRYQIDAKTWGDFGARDLGFTDYSPRTQDVTFAAIVKQDGIDAALASGDFSRILDKASKRWASIPDPATQQSRYSHMRKGRPEPQPSKDAAELKRRYDQYLAEEKARDAAG